MFTKTSQSAETQQAIDYKLLVLLRNRCTWMIIPHLILLTVSALLLKDLRASNPWGIYPYCIVAFSVLSRTVIMQTFFKFYLRKNLLIISLFHLAVVGTGLGWGLLFSQIYEFYGLKSVEGVYGAGIIITLIAGGITTFSSSFYSSVVFFVSMSLFPIVILLNDSKHLVQVLGLIFLGNVVYHIYHSFLANKYLKNSLLNEQMAIDQTHTLQGVMDAIPGMVILVDSKGVYRMVNNYMDGHFKNILLNKNLGSFNPNSKIVAYINDFIKSDQLTSVREMESSDFGVFETYMINLKKVTTPFSGVLIAVHPITELAQARNDLKIHEARSQYASKLASLGELSAGIAHEVNNPLTIIEGAASLIKVILTESPLDKSALENSANKILETSHRIAKIIKSLRTLSGNADNEPFKNLNFNDAISPALEICNSLIKEHDIELRIFAPKNDVALFGNEVQISQVIMNLVSNGIDAIKDMKHARWIEIRYTPSLTWLDISITDSGPGISEHIREHIMEPFFTTKIHGQGTGLGLSISKSIMEIHGGSLELLTEASNTTFRLRFPRMNPINSKN